jgi:CoA:oxalate CoA-transferase
MVGRSTLLAVSFCAAKRASGAITSVSSPVFEGILVVELAQVFAGPLTGRLLAEQGATVVKVERPGGEISRQLPWRSSGRSAYFVQMNRGKLGVMLDLRSDDDAQTLWRLVAEADVVIDGFGPGVLDRFGFDGEAMLRRNERLILCEMSALGREGELGSLRGYDQVGASYSGVAYTAGDQAGGAPAMPPVAMGDAMMGMAAYGAIVTALFERATSGMGQRVDVSLVDAYVQSHSSNIEAYALSGGTIDTRLIGGHNPNVCPAGVFQTPDGRHLYIVALSNEEWFRLCRCIGRPEIISDERFTQNEGRVLHREQALSLIGDWLVECGDRDVALARLGDAGVVAAPVLSLDEVIAHPHLRARGTIEMLHDPVFGEFPVPGPPFRLSRSPRQLLSVAPELGEHNASIANDLIQLRDASRSTV